MFVGEVRDLFVQRLAAGVARLGIIVEQDRLVRNIGRLQQCRHLTGMERRDLEIFHFDEAGPGFPFFLPNGMVIVNGWHPDVLAPIKPGSMGTVLPGHNVQILCVNADEPAAAGTFGRVAVDSTAPLFMFAGYHNEPDKTAKRFTADGRWYLTGDVAMRDKDGYFWFASRDDAPKSK